MGKGGRKLNILFLGDSRTGTTSLQRSMALREMGHRLTLVDDIPWNFGFFHRVDNWFYRKGVSWMGHRSPAINRAVLSTANRGDFDLLWVEKGIYVTARTIAAAKAANPGMLVLGYSPDYMAARHNNSRWFIGHSKLYDLFVTTKSYAVDWQKTMGSRDVMFVGNAYDPATHRPLPLDSGTRAALGGPVGFIGAYEDPRADSIEYLGANGIPVKVFSATWVGRRPAPGVQVIPRPMVADDYAKAINAFDINLCFLRAANLDQQTQRSVEIPACGGFMLAERTAEHQALFKERVEAEFFSGNAELLDKCRFYLAHPSSRKKIAARGLERCLRSGYSYKARISKILETLFSQQEGLPLSRRA